MTKIWAHRGASGTAPENTLAAFARAIQLGADGIELDVHFSSDKRVIVIHDEDVLRTCGKHGLVEEMTLEELKKLDCSNGMAAFVGEPIPTLDEVLDLMKPSGLMVNVELKTNFDGDLGLEKAVHALVKERQMEDEILYSSFNHYSLMRMKAIAPDAKLGILYGDHMYNPWQYASALGVDALHPRYASIWEDGYIKSAHDAGFAVNAWTINDAQDMKRALALGLDGIITNYPDKAIALRG